MKIKQFRRYKTSRLILFIISIIIDNYYIDYIYIYIYIYIIIIIIIISIMNIFKEIIMIYLVHVGFY